MAYGTIKVDNITFTNGGVDQTVTVSGVVQSISGNITATGTIQGQTIIGTSTVSGATVTGDAGVFTTVTGGSAGFTTVTGTTVTGTTANFVNGTFSTQVSGTTVRGTTVSGTTVTGAIGQFTTLTGGTAGFTTVTGTTVTGTTANFQSGVFTTQISGATVTGNAGSFSTITGGTVTLTSGVFGTGTAAAPSIAFTGDSNTGIYSSGADQVAVATNGTGRLFVDASGNVGVGATATTGNLEIGGVTSPSLAIRSTVWSGTAGIYFGDDASGTAGRIQYLNNGDELRILTSGFHAFSNSGGERLRIDSAGRVGIGSSTANKLLQVGDRLGATNGCIEIANANGTNPNDYTFLQFAQSGNPAALSFSTYRYVSGGNWYNDLRFNTGAAGSSSTKMTLTAGGSLGIGTTTPTNTDKLEIQTNSTSAPGLWVQTAGTTSAYPIADFRTGSNLPALSIRGDGASVFNGKVLVGTSSARSNLAKPWAGAFTPNFQIEQGGDTSNTGMALINNSATGYASTFAFAQSRNSSVGGNGAVVSNASLGIMTWQGNDGTNFIRAAQISADVDGTPGANDMPGRLVFSTTADGASSPTERMRIGSNGNVRITQASAAADAFKLDSTDVSYTGSLLTTTTARAAGTTALFLYGLANGVQSIRIYNNGNVENANNSYAAISDIKLKENIVDANSQWDDLKALQIRKYNFKEGQTHTQIGLVAQEVELVSPGLVSESPDRDAEGNDLGTVTKSVNYSVLYMKAVKALQEAMERIETLEQRLNDAGIN